MVSTVSSMSLLAIPGDVQAQFSDYHRLETSPTGISKVAVFFEGQEALSEIDANCAVHPMFSELENELVPTLLAIAVRMVTRHRTGFGSQGSPGCPSYAQATSHNGLLEIHLFIYSHL